MSELSWNWYWGAQSGASWELYLRNRDLVSAVNGGTRASAEYLSSCMSANTRELVGSIGTLERSMGDGFRAVEASVDQMGRQISGAFTWGFNAMLASQGAMQASLDQRVQLSKTPAQTAAYEQFEIARDAFRQGLFIEALEALEQAIHGVPGVSPGYKLEWRFHQLRGLILLGSHENADPKVIDVAKAEEAFLLAARYARKDLPADAAKAMLSAGWAAYVQARPKKLTEALAHTEEAAALDPTLGEALFQSAKFQMAAGNTDAAFPVLAKASQFGVLYLAKAAADGDFKRHEVKLTAFLAALRDEKLRQVAEDARPIAEKIAPLMRECSEFAKNEAAQRVVSMAGCAASMGLVELAEYAANELQRDVDELKRRRFLIVRVSADEWDEEVVEQVPSGESRLVPSGRTETVPTGEMEQYEDEVVVRPAGWFRKELREKVLKQRPVMIERPIMIEQAVTREVRRTVRRRGPETRAQRWIDGFGTIKPYGTAMIPPGAFVLGSSTDNEAASLGAMLSPTVTITRPFKIFATPVTQAVFEQVMRKNPSRFKGANRPVEHVSWFDVVAFCNALSATEGLPPAYRIDGQNVIWVGPQAPGWRLPTEAEWEYACRAGSTVPRYGNLDEIAWYDKNSGRETHDVATKQPNAWGLYDTLGNVREWVWDWYGSYSDGPQTDPTGPQSGSSRVDRGGSWSHGAQYARAAYRDSGAPGYADGLLGFRPLRSLP